MSNIPRTSLRAFLATAKQTLQTGLAQRQKLHFVIGNESCDLDSTTSALLYAYLRSHSSPNHPLYIPLLNIPHADIPIRPELLALLPHANLDPSHLLTLDDLPPPPWHAALPPENTAWTLVDHNKLTGELGDVYAGRVTGCIDHHIDEGAVPADTGAEPRIIQTSGSCTSLIVNYLRPAWDALSDSASSASNAVASGQDDAAGDGLVSGHEDVGLRRLWDAQVAKMALASVLVDTGDLRDEGKTTEEDVRAVEYLEAKIALNARDAWFDRHAFFGEMQKAKRDLDGLSVEECLRKDFKVWVEGGVRLGVSSVVKPLEWLIGKAKGEREGAGDAFKAVLGDFAEQRDLGVCAIMTTSKSNEGQFQRELLLWVRDQKAQGMIEKFTRQARDQLQLESWQDGDFQVKEQDGFQIWWQRKVENSRKQVAPLLRKAMLS